MGYQATLSLCLLNCWFNLAKTCAFGMFLFKIGGLTALATVDDDQPSKKMDGIVPVAVLQLVIMNNRLIRFGVERLVRLKRRAKRVWVHP